MSSETTRPTLEELLRLTQAATLGRIHTITPAVIVAYDPVKQRATVQPTIRIPRTNPETGAREFNKVDVISNCPVLWPSGGGFSITFPLAIGDPVTLLIAERSTDEYRATGAQDVSPQDARRFDWTDALVLPAWRPFADPLPPTGYDPSAMVLSASVVKVGDNTAFDPVVLQSLLSGFLSTLKSWLDLHVHTSAAPGVFTSPPTVSSPPAGTLGSIVLLTNG